MIIPAPLIRRRRNMKKFYQASAVSAENAIEPEKIAVRKSYVFKRMIKRGYLNEAETGKYYLTQKGIRKLKKFKRGL